MTTIVSIAQGGTGARTAANARIALDVPPSAAYGQANLAYAQANSAYGQANAAYGAANTRLSASGGTLSGDLIITGNLTVSGNSTTLNTEILTVEDADVVLLSNVAGTPALNAGVIINRGTSTNTFLRWSEDGDRWGWSDDGTTFYSFDNVRSGLVTTNTTFGTVNTTFGTVNTTFGTVNTTFGTINTTFGTSNTSIGNRVLKAGDTMTGQLNISSGGLLVTGSVGIGTTNPATTLHVDASGGGIVRVSRLGTGSGILQMEADGTDGAISSTNNTRFQTNSTERMRITTSGNVAIGTNASSYARLTLRGPSTTPEFNTTAVANATFQISNSDTDYGTFISSLGSGAGIVQQRRTASATYYDLSLNPYGGNVAIGTTSSSNKLEVDGGSSAVALRISTTNTGSDVASLILSNSSKSAFNDGIKISHGGGYTTFKDLTSNTIMAFDVTNNRVGIGTGSPGVTFHVVAPNAGSIISSSTGTNRVWLRVNNTGGDFYFGREDSTGGFFGTSAAYASVLWSQGAYPLILASNGTERMRITSGGDVGIGTTNPGAKLQISDSSTPQIRLHWSGTAASGNKGSLLFTHNRNSDGTQEGLGYIQGVAEDNQSAGGIRFVARNNSDVEAFRITSGGNIGIATTNPSTKLQVHGEIRQSTDTLGTANTSTFRHNIESGIVMGYTGKSGTISTFAAGSTPNYIKKFFKMDATTAGAFTQTLMQIDSRGTGFNELWVKVIWGTRIQGISDGSANVNERAYGANKFNGVNNTYSIAENWNHIEANSNTYMNIQLVNSGTGGILDLNYVQHSSVSVASFIWGYIEVFSVEPIDGNNVKVFFNC